MVNQPLTDKICITCKEPKPTTEFYVNRTQCKSCKALYSKQYQQDNADKIKITKIKYQQKNAESIIEHRKEWYQKNKARLVAQKAEYRKNNPDLIAKANALHRKNNPAKINAHNAKYRAAKLQRTVAWVDLDKIKDVYFDCVEINLAAKIAGCTEKFVVDHIIPLQGKYVSGLHVENNLQIITDKENLLKKNKFIVQLS